VFACERHSLVDDVATGALSFPHAYKIARTFELLQSIS